MYQAGRTAALRRWFDWFETGGPAGQPVELAVLGAWLSALAGRPAAAERWADAAERAPSGDPPPAGGSTADGCRALLGAALCRDGPERMRSDAEAALALLPAASRWRPTAHLLLGVAHLLAGDLDAADRALADAAELGEGAGVDTATVALAERALVAISRGAWQEAETLAELARSTSRVGRRRRAAATTRPRHAGAGGRRAPDAAGHHAWPRHRGIVADGRRGTALPAAGQPLLVPGDRWPPRPVPAHRRCRSTGSSASRRGARRYSAAGTSACSSDSPATKLLVPVASEAAAADHPARGSPCGAAPGAAGDSSGRSEHLVPP
jgi:hypothetical protein